jgi:hypothetical protein
MPGYGFEASWFGKALRQTYTVTIAKLRLGALERALHSFAEKEQQFQHGKISFGDGLKLTLDPVRRSEYRD